MGDTPVFPGPPGILQRSEEMRDVLTKPLTPDEMFQYGVQNTRGFWSSPGSKQDVHRKQPATINIDPKGVGTPVGKGYETFGAIQIVDADGKQVAFVTEYFDKGGLDNHAEARAIRGLEKFAPDASVQGSKMIVVVDQEVCPSYRQRLLDYAKKKGVAEVEIHLPERADMRVPGKTASPKTSARTSLQGGRPPLTIKKQETITLRKPVPRINVPDTGARKSVSGGADKPGPKGMGLKGDNSIRTAVKGAVVGTAAGLAAGLLTSKFKEEMLKSLENMPKPKIDKRSAGEFFSDPNTGKAIRLIDLLNKNLKPFGEALVLHHQEVIGRTNLEIYLLAASSVQDPERLEFLSGLESELDVYWNQLLAIRDNLEAAKGLEAKALDAAKGAEELANMVEQPLVTKWLFDTGFDVNEIVTIWENLKSYASRVRRVFAQIGELHNQVERMIDEHSKLCSGVNKIYWHIVGSRIAEEMKKRQGANAGQ